ncbi:hypothetical protein T439DRAFT_329399 [Meredithblackwellia eburnea MCA 4105]
MARKKSQTSPQSPPTTASTAIQPQQQQQQQQPAQPNQQKLNRPTQVFKPPKKISFFKRSIIWYESSFAISMLEPWEKILLHTFALALVFLLYFGVSRYLPGHLRRIAERVTFYIYGSESGLQG